jgi:hypothetical protein
MVLYPKEGYLFAMQEYTPSSFRMSYRFPNTYERNERHYFETFRVKILESQKLLGATTKLHTYPIVL